MAETKLIATVAEDATRVAENSGSLISRSFESLKSVGSSAWNVLSSKPVTGTAKIATAAGVAYLGSIALSKTGSNIRQAVGMPNANDSKTAELQYRADSLGISQQELDFQKTYDDYLKQRQLADTPSSYAAFVNDPRGAGASTAPPAAAPSAVGSALPFILIGGGILVAAIVANNMTKKAPAKA